MSGERQFFRARSSEKLSKWPLLVSLSPTAAFIAVLVVLLRSWPSPFVWAVAAFYLGFVALVTGLLARTLVRARNVPAEQKGLWLSTSELGFTDFRGRIRTCRRDDVASCLKVIIPITQPMKELLVFRNAAGAVLLSVPISLGRQDVIAPLCAELGIETPHLKYINTVAAADESLPGFALGRVKHTWRRTDTRLLLVTVIGVIVALTALVLLTAR